MKPIRIGKSIYLTADLLKKVDKMKKAFEKETKVAYKFNDVITRLIEEKEV